LTTKLEGEIQRVKRKLDTLVAGDREVDADMEDAPEKIYSKLKSNRVKLAKQKRSKLNMCLCTKTFGKDFTRPTF
jgi:hypothetical protein